jgi:hypothetical protein
VFLDKSDQLSNLCVRELDVGDWHCSGINRSSCHKRQSRRLAGNEAKCIHRVIGLDRRYDLGAPANPADRGDFQAGTTESCQKTGTRGRSRLSRVGMSRLHSHLTYANIISSLALFLAISGGAWAASGGLLSSNGYVRACVPRDGGLLRVVRPHSRCKSSQQTLVLPSSTATVLRRVGPSGPTGPRATGGAMGPAGATGPQGAVPRSIKRSAVTRCV